MKERGQAWGLDATVAAMLFVGGIIIFYVYSINYKASEKVEIEESKFEAALLAESLLSEGEPQGWNTTAVSKIGITSKEEINETKLEDWYELVITDYNRTRTLLNTRYEYRVIFSEPLQIGAFSVNEIGPALPNNTERVWRITRFSSYHQKPLTLDVIVWKR